MAGPLAGRKLRRPREYHGQFTGRHQSREYKAWAGMIRRCTTPKPSDRAYYAGRGITVCDRWRDSFVAFYEDMGPKPSPGHSLDRIDNERGYEPGNCRWATRTEQMRNTRGNRRITFQGETLTVVEWEERLGVSRGSVSRRLKTMSDEDAVSRPFKTRGQHDRHA